MIRSTMLSISADKAALLSTLCLSCGTAWTSSSFGSLPSKDTSSRMHLSRSSEPLSIDFLYFSQLDNPLSSHSYADATLRTALVLYPGTVAFNKLLSLSPQGCSVSSELDPEPMFRRNWQVVVG